MHGTARPMRRTAIALGTLGLVTLGAALLVYLAGRAPAFYHEIDLLPHDERNAESRQFVRLSTGILNQIVNEPAWSGKFRATQVNAWLASDFAEKHAGILPAGVSEPRVAFGQDRFTLAFQMKRGPFTAVVSVVGRMWLPEPNLVAIEFEAVQAGAIPLPASSVISTLSSSAKSAGLAVEWKQHDGHPVALLRFASGTGAGRIEVERVELRAGALHVAGRASIDERADHRTAGSPDDGSRGTSRNVQAPDSSLKR